jgi:steroid delta-isomerase-like uncharacterized protein
VDVRGSASGFARHALDHQCRAVLRIYSILVTASASGFTEVEKPVCLPVTDPDECTEVTLQTRTTPTNGRRPDMSVDTTRDVVTRYIDSAHTDLSMMADDVVFTHMATGEEHRGPEGVRAMLQYIYHVAFDAHAETKSLIIADDKAVLEGDFVGRHIGEFAGVPATGRTVRVPLCVVYDLEKGQIKRGRVYMEMPVLLRQLQSGAAVGA